MFFRALRKPHVEEERARARAIWDSLPAGLHTPDQGFGRWSTGCGAAWGVMARCDFGCTACYLAKGSNQTEAMPIEEVRAQIDTLREHMGAGARIQITAGEVTLLPCDNLIRIVKHARGCGVVPMVMTHGQRFLREPNYLERLVREAGLDRFSFHVDTTQRGRDGGDPDTEAELMGVRDAMADLIRRTRKRTGQKLYAAHTVTVTAENLPELPAIVRWCLQNADAARLLGRLLRDPRPLFDAASFCTVRLLGDWRLLKRPRPFVINVHKFMDADALDTPAGRERVATCVFKLPVDGELVSMCAFNGGGQRAAKIAERIASKGTAGAVVGS